MVSHTTLEKTPKSPRTTKKLRAQLLSIPHVRTAREEILKRRAATGSDLTQDDVDLAARALLSARERPYPQAIVVVAGGSLSTIGPMFHDWFMRFAFRDADPNSPTLDMPTRISLHVQRLVAQLEAAVREQIRGVPDPTQALMAAAQLGEQQGLRMQLATIAAERERLSEALAAMTYKVSELESQLAARAAAELTSNTELQRATERLQTTFEQLRAQLAQPIPTANAALTRLAGEVRQLRADLARPPRSRPVKSATLKPQERLRKSFAAKSRARGHPATRSPRRIVRATRIRPSSRRR